MLVTYSPYPSEIDLFAISGKKKLENHNDHLNTESLELEL